MTTINQEKKQTHFEFVNKEGIHFTLSIHVLKHSFYDWLNVYYMRDSDGRDWLRENYYKETPSQTYNLCQFFYSEYLRAKPVKELDRVKIALALHSYKVRFFQRVLFNQRKFSILKFVKTIFHIGEMLPKR